MENIFELVHVFVCVFEAYLMFDFYTSFFSFREMFQKKHIKIEAVVMTAFCVRLINYLNSPILNGITLQFIYLFILLIMFYGTIIKKLLYYMVAIAILIGSKVLWIRLISLPRDFTIGNFRESSVAMHISLLGVETVALILFFMVKRIAKLPRSKMDINTLLIYSIVPTATLGIMVALVYLNINFDSTVIMQGILIICSMLLIVGNRLVFSVLDTYIAYKEKLHIQAHRIAEMELKEKRYMQIEANNQENARFLHDMRHYMSTIGELAIENKYKEILDILSKLQIKISDGETKLYCSNRFLNSILNEKKKEADEKSIVMKITLEPEFNIDQVENTDLIAIMGNLLDNAIEAAHECDKGYIHLYLYTQNEACFSIIKIVNNYAGSIEVHSGKLITKKDNKARHGFGTGNVAAVVEKYGGYVDVTYDEDVFTVVVLLPNNK